MKLSIYISMVCVGTWGLISVAFPNHVKEIFLGMVIPWSISLISISKTHSVYNINPEKLIKHMTKAMLMKMVSYGILLVIIFTFISFNPLPFIISFTGYFLALHIIEAFTLRFIIKKNQYNL